ncbi:hypothetical protein AB6A40_001804 [Gnathostoma spinigerum]|uniref:Uncharacterized protein n=1 Tax=Gnathostoma spinigerum TaxID=75299 RepID=A0ABD6E534_9BILA
MRIAVFAVSLFVVTKCKDVNFDYFVLAQTNPYAKCFSANGDLRCEVPNKTPQWTIHGLWPSRIRGKGPFYCQSPEYKFQKSRLKPIELELEKNWPNVYPDKSKYSLWKHEWEKHGSCTIGTPGFQHEINYFNISLGLHETFNIERALKASRVAPSMTSNYSLSDIILSLKNQLSSGKEVKLICVSNPSTGQVMLLEIELCIDKQLRTISCSDEMLSFSFDRNGKPGSCPETGIAYIPAQSTANIGPRKGCHNFKWNIGCLMLSFYSLYELFFNHLR